MPFMIRRSRHIKRLIKPFMYIMDAVPNESGARYRELIDTPPGAVLRGTIACYIVFFHFLIMTPDKRPAVCALQYVQRK